MTGTSTLRRAARLELQAALRQLACMSLQKDVLPCNRVSALKLREVSHGMAAGQLSPQPGPDWAGCRSLQVIRDVQPQSNLGPGRDWQRRMFRQVRL
jgi:hypothetical protein